MTEVDPENVTSVGDEPTKVVTMPVTCPVPGCGVEIDAEGDTCGAVKAALLNIHFETVHKAATVVSTFRQNAVSVQQSRGANSGFSVWP